jgi:photosystem II stability/assembly factor-like uncharacterized protein
MLQRCCAIAILILAASAFLGCEEGGIEGVSLGGGSGGPPLKPGPPPITRFFVEALSPTIVRFDWSYESGYAFDKMAVERRNESGEWQVIGETLSGYADYPLKPNTEYEYRIRSFGGEGLSYGASAYSQPAKVKTFPNDGIWKEIDFTDRKYNPNIPYAFHSFQDAAFVDEQVGVAVGTGIFRTTDGGLTWIRILGETDLFLDAVDFESGGFGVVGGVGKAFITNDGGASWSRQEMSSFESIQAVQIISTDVIYMVAHGHFAQGDGISSTRGIFLKSLNGGRNWLRNDSLLTPARFSSSLFHDVYFITAETGFLVGYNGAKPVILGTTDGGAIWKDVSPIPSVNGVGYPKIHFFDEDNGIASFGTHLFMTADQGQTWQAHGAIPDGQNWSFLNSQNVGFMVGSGRIWRTNNRGISWQAETVPSINLLLGVAFAGSKRVVAVGSFGTILIRDL